MKTYEKPQVYVDTLAATEAIASVIPLYTEDDENSVFASINTNWDGIWDDENN